MLGIYNNMALGLVITGLSALASRARLRLPAHLRHPAEVGRDVRTLGFVFFFSFRWSG
jgi:hypothetical protein